MRRRRLATVLFEVCAAFLILLLWFGFVRGGGEGDEHGGGHEHEHGTEQTGH